MSHPLFWSHQYRRRNASGSMSYVVDGGLVARADGATVRERYCFKAKKAADAKAAELRTNREQRGTIAARQHAQAAAQLHECLPVMTASGIGSLKETPPTKGVCPQDRGFSRIL